MDKNKKFKVKIIKTDETVFLKEGTLLEGLNGEKKAINQSCGGMGSCGTCRVIVEKSSTVLSERTDVEREMAVDRGFEEKERLACQLEVEGSMEIMIP